MMRVSRPDSGSAEPKGDMHMAKCVPAAAACVILALLALMLYRSAASILGPSDKPDFRNMQWEKMSVVYHVRVAENRMQRRKCELGREDVERARLAFSVFSIQGLSIGANDDLRITMANGDVWIGEFVFGDRVYLCLEREKYYSYALELCDRGFYDTLREVCLANEKRTVPGAGTNHIILNPGLDPQGYDILPPRQSREAE